jgi:predicted cobalt transporter CbtA
MGHTGCRRQDATVTLQPEIGWSVYWRSPGTAASGESPRCSLTKVLWQEWWVAYVAQTAVNGVSELLIFVRRRFAAVTCRCHLVGGRSPSPVGSGSRSHGRTNRLHA